MVEVAATVVVPLLAGLLLVLDGLVVGEVNDSGRTVDEAAVVAAAADVVELLTATVDDSSWADISGDQVKVKVANANSKVGHCIVTG